jgi:hypothetical protein
MKAARLILGICVVQPIWLYLLYQILVRVEASELMWFLYWIYLPAAIVSLTAATLLEQEKK